MRKIYFVTALMLCFCIHTDAQNPGGKSYFADVNVFNSPGPGQGVIRFFNCGNDPSLALDEALTVEFWFKAAIPSDNQKFIGKINSTGATFNNGYLVGIANSRINPEIWTPSNQNFEQGFITPIPTWHHIAITYQSGDMYRAYLNGTLVHEQAATGDIVTSSADLIIGVGPWGNMDAFMAFGAVDEIRLWNVERTAEQLKTDMFKNLTGAEPGLVLYQNFDNDDGSDVVVDRSNFGNNCTKIGMDDSNFIDSECVIANMSTQSTNDLNGIWFSTSIQDPRMVSTDNGLSAAAYFNGQDTSAYFIWGHTGLEGTTPDDLPADAPANSMRTDREWVVTAFGDIAPNMTFNLDDAAGSGAALPTGLAPEFYTLLELRVDADNFVAIANADEVNGSDVTFNSVPVEEGASYAVATGDAPFVVTNIFEVDKNDLAASIFPNPTEGRLNIQLNEQISNANIMVYNTVGQLVQSMNTNTLLTEIQIENAGVYLVRIEADGKTFNQRVIVAD